MHTIFIPHCRVHEIILRQRPSFTVHKLNGDVLGILIRAVRKKLDRRSESFEQRHVLHRRAYHCRVHCSAQFHRSIVRHQKRWCYLFYIKIFLHKIRKKILKRKRYSIKNSRREAKRTLKISNKLLRGATVLSRHA